MRRVYQVTSLIFLAVGLFAVFTATKLKYYGELGPGPGFFPLWLGLIFSGLAVGWFAHVSLRPVDEMEPGFMPDRAGVIRVLSIVVALAAYTILLETLGFQLLTLIFLLALLVTLGRQNPVVTILIGLVGSFGIYYLFRNWLNVPLPTSSIEFLHNLGL